MGHGAWGMGYSGSHSDAIQHYIAGCRGTALPIGVNLSSNAYPTDVFPPLNPLTKVGILYLVIF
jgi:hypothetical protein